MLGFFLEPYHSSFRKRLSQKPKFYFFDIGVTKALCHLLSLPVLPRTAAFGESFEHFIILECQKLASYYRLNYRFSYLRTKDDAEIDLIVERPGQPLLCIEIKSAESVSADDIRSFADITSDLPNSVAVCLCNEPIARKVGHVSVLPWKEGLMQFFQRDAGIPDRAIITPT